MTEPAGTAIADASEPVPAPDSARAATERRLRIAGGLLVLGMLVEAGTLLALDRPAGFLTFAGVAAGLMLAGVLYYLWSIVR